MSAVRQRAEQATQRSRAQSPSSTTGGDHPLLRMQKTCGNRATQRLVEHVQRYALTHTAYTGNAFSWQAVALRASSPHGLKNIASIKLTGKDLVTASSIPPGPKGVTPKHSEQVVWEAVAGEVTSGARQIEWVYTEREPCGRGPGMKNCAQFLTGLLARYGVAGNATPVYYSFNYPSVREVTDVAKMLVQQGVVGNEDDAYDGAYDLWIQEHGETKQMIAEAQKMFSQPGPWGASAMSS